ncbi:MAG: beta-N-acetylhexosaminidase [Candidatus Merdivicinus sp.]|jgi:hexosaminidase
MKKLCVKTAPARWREGLELLAGDLDFALDETGLLLTVGISDRLEVRFDGREAFISCREKAHFYRGVALLLRELDKGASFSLEESPAFEKTGAMFDVSRNAVLKPESVKLLLRKMACMGMNAAMLYTEDTYEVPGYPYFGYQRGAYSADVIKELDDYADALGIELIPCIQTLGHLGNVLKWERMKPYADTAEVLLCDNDEVYRLIEDMIVAASSPVRSKRIHIGMDEAMDLGLGRFLQQHGYENGFSIIARHFDRVMEILRRHGLAPLIWSDTYFRLASKTADYYDLEGTIPQEVIDRTPRDAALVYWDYYHLDEAFYEDFIARHKRFPNRLVFAGGLWTWSTLAVHYGMAFRTSVPALRQCRKQGVQEVFVTMWGDDGAESSLLSSLLGLQLYAESTFAEDVSLERLRDRFAACTGESMDAFLDISRMDVPGWSIPEDGLPPLESHYYSRVILYADPLLDLFAKNLEGIDLTEHYRQMVPLMERHASESRSCAQIFHYYAVLADFLADKCTLPERIRTAYRGGNREVLSQLAQTDIPALVKKAESLRISWRELWFAYNKPFGFEVLDTRLGGAAARLETAAARLAEYLDRGCEKIDELETAPLPMDDVWQWQRMISASRI